MQPLPDAVARQTMNGRPLSVLVVEDEAIVARDLERSLSDLGYEVVGAVTSGDDALRATAERRPDIVLMDIRIAGDSDGIETAALLRKRFQVPIIYLTAYADDQTVARAAETAPYGYLVKPFTTREVRCAIEVARSRCESDRQLASREQWFSTTLSSIGDAVVACDSERRVAFMNPAAETLTGWRASEAIGRDVDEVVRLSARDGHTMGRVVERALERRSVETIPSRTLLVGRSEGTREVDDCASAIVHDGSLLGAVIVLRDVTEQEELRQRAAMSERLAALGTLAAGVAHEINNPLTFVMGTAHNLQRLVEDWRVPSSVEDERQRLALARDFVTTLSDGAERIKRIVADMSVFGQGRGMATSPTDVVASMEWALRVTSNHVRHRAQIVTDIQPTPFVMASESELGQVFVNLLVNAAQAIPQDGREDHVVRVVTRTDDDGCALISVRDTGVGMSPEVQSRIFDPFFTTKEPGTGTGLGLSICHRIVEGLGGRIRVSSSPAGGTCFEVRLPKACAQRRAAPPAPVTETLHGRVLLIDDDPGVLRSIAHLLAADHEVTAVEGAAAALERLERDEAFDVILCDLMMPGVDGRQFVGRVRERWPELESAVLLMTGGAFTPQAVEFLSQLKTPYIEKPFHPDTLKRVVQERIQARRQSPQS